MANPIIIPSDANLQTSDIVTNDISITKHGFCPKAPNDVTKFLRGDATWDVPGGGGGLEETIIGKFWAGDFDYFEANIAPLDLDVGANVLKIKRQLFDDTTEEFVNFQIFCPSDLASGETIYIDIYGYATTATASKNVKMKFYHSARAVGETWDAAYSTDDSGDVAVSGTQDFIDKITISDTVANYGWTAGDIVFCKLSRVDASANDLVGDYGVILVIVRRG